MTLARTLASDQFPLRARSSRKARGHPDAWGLVKGSADSEQRYCANFGHRQDDETGTYTDGSPDGDGLVYMRARYYEPTTGRFVSEDPARDGINWFDYANSDPVNECDQSGKSSNFDRNLQRMLTILLGAVGAACLAEGCVGLYYSDGMDALEIGLSAEMISRGLLYLTLSYAVACTSKWRNSAAAAGLGILLNRFVQTETAGLIAGAKTEAAPAVWATFLYSCAIMIEIGSLMIQD